MKPKNDSFLKFIKLSFSIVFLFLVNIRVVLAEGECNDFLGNVNDPNDFAYFLNQIFKIIQLVGPLLVIVLTIFELVKCVASQDKDAMNKMGKKTVSRVIYATMLFVIPSVLDFFFRFFSIYGVCGIN